MLAWLLWQLERIERVHAVAGMLIGEFGVEAGGEARRRERRGQPAPGTAREWRRVASVIARKAPKPAALDAATRPTLLEFGSARRPDVDRPEPAAGVPDPICLRNA